MGARRLFGTDGVRGLANGELLTPELAVAARRVGRPRARRARPLAPAGRRRRPRPAGQRGDAGGRGRRRAHLGRAPTRVRVGRAAHARRRAPGRRARRRPRRDDLRVAQRDAGQRHQAVRRRRAQAARRRRGRDRGRGRRRRRDRPTGAGDRPRPRPARRRAPATPSTCSRPRPARSTGLRVVVDCAHGAASAVAPEAYRRAGAEVIALHADPTGSTSTTASGPRTSTRCGEAVRAHGADLGIAHDGDADRCLAVDATGAVVDGDQIMAVLALAMRDAGELARRHARRHRDEQPRPAPGDAGQAGITMRTTAVGDRYVLEELRAGGFTPRRRAVRARRPARARHHRRRPAHRAAADGPDGGHRHVARRAGRRSSPAAAGAGERAGRRQGRRRGVGRRCATPSPPRRPSSATPAGCCCGPRAPSSWSG